MMRSMFSAISGLKNHQTFMDVVGNNIANVNTTGFKQSRVTFQDILSQTVRGASGPQGGRGGVNPMQVGLGTLISGIDTIQTQGTLQSTGKSTDMAIQGDGYFVTSDASRTTTPATAPSTSASTTRWSTPPAACACRAGRPTRSRV
jgi:flagellar hook protein FlgE